MKSLKTLKRCFDELNGIHSVAAFFYEKYLLSSERLCLRSVNELLQVDENNIMSHSYRKVLIKFGHYWKIILAMDQKEKKTTHELIISKSVL